MKNKYILIVSGVFLVAVLAAWLLFSRMGIPSLLAVRQGKNNAPVQIVVYSDVFCPYCRIWYQQVLPYLSPYIESGKLEYVHVTVPFIQETRPVSRDVLAALYCVSYAGGDQIYFERWLYTVADSQMISSSETITKIARESGAQQKQFIDCYLGPARTLLDKAILEQEKRIEPFLVNGVPAVYLNGKQIKEWGNPAIFLLYLENQ